MYFSRYAGRVVMIVRGESLSTSMSQYLINQIGATPNIEVLTHSGVVEAHGETGLQSLTIANVLTGQQEVVPASGLFIFIGAMPRTD